MRIRYIKPSFFLSEVLAELPFEMRIIYAGLWCCADREGRLENRPKRLKAEIMPYDNVDMEKTIEALCNKNLIIKYENDGEQYLQIEKWKTHQRIHHTEKDSIIPSYTNSNSIIISKGKGKGKGKAGKGKREIPNGEIPVKQPLKDNLLQLFNEIQHKFTSTELTLSKEFLSYWTEKSKGGKKERWEMQTVFDVARRFRTWINNNKKFGKFALQDENIAAEFHEELKRRGEL